MKDIPSVAHKSRSDVAGKPTTSITPVKDIYVGNLDHRTTEQEIQRVFERVGIVVHVVIPRDSLTDRNRGYAFVRMADSATSLKALTEINGQLLRNRPLKLGWSSR